MKLWIDDLREPPGKDWHWAKTSAEAIEFLQTSKSTGASLSEVSFDHDLGGDDTTRRVVTWMIYEEYFPSIARCHSMNPVGRDWIEQMISRYFV